MQLQYAQPARQDLWGDYVAWSNLQSSWTSYSQQQQAQYALPVQPSAMADSSQPPPSYAATIAGQTIGQPYTLPAYYPAKTTYSGYGYSYGQSTTGTFFQQQPAQTRSPMYRADPVPQNGGDCCCVIL